MGLDSVGETCSEMWQGKPRLTVASNQTKLAISTIFNVAMSVEKWLLTCYTARKTIFSFSRLSEKMVFPKKLCWNMIFLVILGKMIFLFPENIILYLRRKMKDDLSQKKYTEIWYFLQTFSKDGLSHMIFYVLSGKMVFFSRKDDIFSLGRKWEAVLLRKYMEIWHFLCTRVLQTWCHAPLPKKLKIVSSRKNTPKGDWHSRLIS